jgi:capsular exopolysaccharide synthesis family protein
MSILEPASVAWMTKAGAAQKLAQAIFLAVAAGLGLILLVKSFDDRVLSLEELTESFDIEAVGQIPEMTRRRQKGELPLVELDDERHGFAESFRSLRSSLLFRSDGAQQPRAILVTSASPNEGKTTVSANLARTLAFAGSRVLLVDADMRRGSLHKMMGVPQSPGLSDCLKGDCSSSGLIRPTQINQLSIIPTGTHQHHSSELLLNARFDELLQEIRAQFDYIIFDSPPVFATDDATTLGPKLDGVMFVVRSAHTRASLVRRALSLLEQRNARLLGLIFNRANASARSYYYYKYASYYRAKQPETREKPSKAVAPTP